SNFRVLMRCNMFQGLRTIVYPVSDLTKAKEWYTTMLGKAPYFDQPFYVGFNVGGYELGLTPNGGASKGSTTTTGGNSTSYWGVSNIEEALSQLLQHGAVAH